MPQKCKYDMKIFHDILKWLFLLTNHETKRYYEIFLVQRIQFEKIFRMILWLTLNFYFRLTLVGILVSGHMRSRLSKLSKLQSKVSSQVTGTVKVQSKSRHPHENTMTAAALHIFLIATIIVQTTICNPVNLGSDVNSIDSIQR